MRFKHYTLQLIFLIAFTFFANVVQAAGEKYYFDFNDRCNRAYEAMMSLRIKDANVLLQEELKEHPQNLIPVMIANYDDCLTLVFNGDANEYKKRKANLDKRINLIEKGDQNSPWYRYAKGTLYFQWAVVRLRFDEYFSGGTEFRKSFIQLKENRKKFPQFKYNQILLGLEEAIVGTVPDKYKWIANMLGMTGNVKKGTAQIVDFLNTRDNRANVLREEAVFYYAYLKFYLLSEQKSAWKYIDDSQLDFKGNHLYAFMKGKFALDDNKAQLAEQTFKNRTQTNAYLEVPLFNYFQGVALLQKTDEDCLSYFQKFLSRYRGRMFVKDAYQKMNFYSIVAGNAQQAATYKSKILTSGTTQIDADKQAQRYAQNSVQPDATLLRARLLCDGGYFDKALQQLQGKKSTDFASEADRLEFSYRLGRIYALTGKAQAAITYYETTIKAGSTRPEHFAARSAFEMGQIYEQQGNKSKAIESYRRCIAMKGHDFESSLEQKSKAGINRLGGK